MGSRWLLVPTQTAQSLVRLREKASCCMPYRFELALSNTCLLSDLAVLKLFITEKSY